MFKSFKKRVSNNISNTFNVLNFEIKKPDLNKLAYKYSAKVIISNFV